MRITFLPKLLLNKVDKSNLALSLQGLFLSKAERDYLMANSEIHGGHGRVIKSRLQEKIDQSTREELPLLVEKGYLEVKNSVTLQKTVTP